MTVREFIKELTQLREQTKRIPVSESLPESRDICMNIGDRVKFMTIGGWYNSGIIKDMDEDSYLIEVDELGYRPPGIAFIPLPYYVRVFKASVEKSESEEG